MDYIIEPSSILKSTERPNSNSKAELKRVTFALKLPARKSSRLSCSFSKID